MSSWQQGLGSKWQCAEETRLVSCDREFGVQVMHGTAVYPSWLARLLCQASGLVLELVPAALCPSSLSIGCARNMGEPIGLMRTGHDPHIGPLQPP